MNVGAVKTPTIRRSQSCKRTDQCCTREENPCQLGAVHTWHIASVCPRVADGRFQREADIPDRNLLPQNVLGSPTVLIGKRVGAPLARNSLQFGLASPRRLHSLARNYPVPLISRHKGCGGAEGDGRQRRLGNLIYPNAAEFEWRHIVQKSNLHEGERHVATIYYRHCYPLLRSAFRLVQATPLLKTVAVVGTEVAASMAADFAEAGGAEEEGGAITGAELPPARSSAGCSLRPIIMGPPAITTATAAAAGCACGFCAVVIGWCGASGAAGNVQDT